MCAIVLQAMQQIGHNAGEGTAEIAVEDAVDDGVDGGVGVAQPGYRLGKGNAKLAKCYRLIRK